VETVNVALAVPAGTITMSGTVAMAALLLASAITAPPAGAVVVRVTVPVEGLRSGTVVGLRLSEARGEGVKINARPAGPPTPTIWPQPTIWPALLMAFAASRSQPESAGIPLLRSW